MIHAKANIYYEITEFVIYTQNKIYLKLSGIACNTDLLC
jgi:hypothetical protein